MAVIDIARTSVVTAAPNATLTEVARRMHEEAVGSVVVVEAGAPIGCVTDRDLAMTVIDEGRDAAETAVGDVLPEDLVTVDADAGVYDLFELFSEQGVRRVPVVEDGDLAGIVSLSDLVVLLGMELQHLATAVRSSAPAYERPGPDYYRG